MSTERKTRVETEEAVVEVLKEMVTKVKKDLDGEKKNRCQNEEALLSLLETTIAKLNKTAHIQI